MSPLGIGTALAFMRFCCPISSIFTLALMPFFVLNLLDNILMWHRLKTGLRLDTGPEKKRTL